jgi:hypothetical protein
LAIRSGDNAPGLFNSVSVHPDAVVFDIQVPSDAIAVPEYNIYASGKSIVGVLHELKNGDDVVSHQVFAKSGKHTRVNPKWYLLF